MEMSRRATTDGTIVPDRYAVRLNPSDIATLPDGGSPLATDLADDALRFARAHGYRLLARPRIDLVPDPHVTSGDVSVDARFEAPAGQRAGATDGPPPASAEGAPETWAETPPPDATMVYRPPRTVGPLATVRIHERSGADRAIVIDGTGASVGRDPTNDVVLGDPQASRRHARFQVRQGPLLLVDLGSRNGTYVNGVAVGEIALGVGDEIRIGDTRLRVEGPPPA